MNKIFNERCEVTMFETLQEKSVNLVLTSPPYNTASNSKHIDNKRYDVYKDTMSDEEYFKSTIKWFEGYDRILKQNGCVLYNISYSTEKPSMMLILIAEIIIKSNFIVVDTLCWKKNAAWPNDKSPNRLTRIWEPVYVFCRKKEMKTFFCNKKVVSYYEGTNIRQYENIFNHFETRNNDKTNNLNKATFSTDFARTLLQIYGAPFPEFIVYDSFMGTGTTAEAALLEKMSYVGSELSGEQCKFAENRLKTRLVKQTLF